MAKYRISSKRYTLRDFSEPLSKDASLYSDAYFSIANLESPTTKMNLKEMENSLIKIYRQMALNPYVEWAIEDIITEMISIDEEQPYPISIILDDTEFSDNIKEKISEYYKELLSKIQFPKKGSNYMRQWYIDGRAYFYIEYHKNINKGVRCITMLDPLRTQFIKKPIYDGATDVNNPEEFEEYYLYYNDTDFQSVLLRIEPENMIEINSDLMDSERLIYVSNLHKAMKSLNQLTSIEDAFVIYRLSRAPERRVFYVDVGELPKTKAEAHMKDLISNYRNRMSYDSNTGTVKEQTLQASILDDVWLTRRGEGRGTEVQTLAGATGQFLQNTEDLDYFLHKLFRSLNVPFSRWNAQDGGMFSGIGRSSEITRDEVKYSKFISRLRMQFNTLFYYLLKRELITRKVLKPEEFDENEHLMAFRYESDTLFSELKETDLLRERLGLLNEVNNYTGSYFSKEYIIKTILRRTDDEADEIARQIEAEKKTEDGGSPIIPVDAFGGDMLKGNMAQGVDVNMDAEPDFSNYDKRNNQPPKEENIEIVNNEGE